MKEFIFHLEGVDILQAVRLNGEVQIHSLKDDKVNLKSAYNFYLLKDKLKFKKYIMMIVKEVKR